MHCDQKAIKIEKCDQKRSKVKVWWSESDQNQGYHDQKLLKQR
jgi:hypothetical protein